jgi:hypothetical protein
MLPVCAITKMNEARRIKRSMLKTNLKIAVAALMLSAAAMAQQARIYQESGGWAQEVSGTLASVKNLHVRVEAGAVNVVGGSSSGISYQMITRARTSSEEKARRQYP